MDLSKYFCKKPSDISDKDALKYVLSKAKEEMIVEAYNQFDRAACIAMGKYFKEQNKK